MSAPNIPLNKSKTDPSLADLLDLWKRDVQISTNCHGVGTIQSFDATTQLAKVTMNYTQTIFTYDQSSGQWVATNPKYSILLDVPVIVVSGGEAGMTMPIAEGDTCLVMFNDVALDSWLNSGQLGPVSSPRRHSFSDAIALVGLSSKADPIESYDTARLKLYNGTTFVALGGSLVEINNAAGHSLGALMSQLMTDLSTLATGLQANPGTETAAAASGIALAAAITTLNTLLAGLLA